MSKKLACVWILAAFGGIVAGQTIGNPPVIPIQSAASQLMAEFAKVMKFDAALQPAYSPVFMDGNIAGGEVEIATGSTPWSNESFVFVAQVAVALDYQDRDLSEEDTEALGASQFAIVGGTMYSPGGLADCIGLAISYTDKQGTHNAFWVLESVTLTELLEFAANISEFEQRLTFPVCQTRTPAYESYVDLRIQAAQCQADVLRRNIPSAGAGGFIAGFSCTVALTPPWITPINGVAAAACLSSGGWTLLLIHNTRVKAAEIVNNARLDIGCACAAVQDDSNVSFLDLKSGCGIPDCSP